MKFAPRGPGTDLASSEKSDRVRLLLLIAAFIVVAVPFLYFLMRERVGVEPAAEVPPGPQIETVIATPRVDVERLRSLARDATPAQRAVVEVPALEAAMESARLLSDVHFEPMEGRLLDSGLAEEIAADPDEWRGRLLRARGWIAESTRHPSVAGSPEHVRGLLRLEDGGSSWFAVRALPDAVGVDDFVRVDALFVEAFRKETPEGWIDAPLIVGPRAVRSRPRMEPVTEIRPTLFLDVEDDSLQGMTGLPYDEYWKLLSFAASEEAASVDWASAPLLDEERMAALLADGRGWRGAPMRLPPSEVLDLWPEAAGENPLRLAKVTKGWLGNWRWMKVSNGLVQAAAPFGSTEAKKGDDVAARGFFLKNLAYEPRDGGIAIAPFFVLHSIEVLPPKGEDPTWQILLWIFGATFLLLLAAIFALLLRDRRRSQELQEELLRRRRARRAQTQP